MKIDQKHKIDKLSIRQTSRLFGERKACARAQFKRLLFTHTQTNTHKRKLHTNKLSLKKQFERIADEKKKQSVTGRTINKLPNRQE